VSSLTDQDVRERIGSVAHWYHRIEIRPGIVTPGISPSAELTLRHLDLPERCDGMRVLDVGARDGFFSFELERRGADVVAVDYMDPGETGFAVARELLSSQVDYLVDNVYRLSRERHGEFDVVLFLGMLYHLRDPLLALDRLWDVCGDGGLLAVETQLLDNALLRADGSVTRLERDLADVALMQFYPGAMLNGDATNYWSPNSACMRGLLEEAGFEPTREVVLDWRGLFQARKTQREEQIYLRRLEKSTPAEAVVPPAASPEQQRIAALEAELAAAHERIAALEAR